METRAQVRKPGIGASPTSDEQLVARARLGDRHAFEELVRRHRRPLVNHLFRQIGREDAAWDLAQEVFLKIYLSLGSFDPAYRFTTWLYRIATNCAVDHLRRKRLPTCPLQSGADEGRGVTREASLCGREPTPDEMLRLRELQERLETAVACLPAEFRQLILLRHRLHRRYDEIARITNLPIGTVKNRIFRARELLRERLADLLPHEA